jgi:membrane protein YqaA with SNARE-associated domain
MPAEAIASAKRGGWLRRVAALSNHRYGTWMLFAIAFADSSFLPLPPDLMLVPMCLLQPRRLRFLMCVCIVGSSLGAIVGYLIGYGLWSLIGERLMELYGYGEKFVAYQQLVEEWGFTVIILKAFTPIPFKIAAIAAGVAAMNPVIFMLATVLGRTLHFAMVAGLLMLFGARITALVARYERPLALLSLLVLIVVALVLWLR